MPRSPRLLALAIAPTASPPDERSPLFSTALLSIVLARPDNCPRWDSNPHDQLWSTDFKSVASANSATRAWASFPLNIAELPQLSRVLVRSPSATKLAFTVPDSVGDGGDLLNDHPTCRTIRWNAGRYGGPISYWLQSLADVPDFSRCEMVWVRPSI